MATRKRKFWNEGGIPELSENPPPRAPQPSPGTVTVGHSTSHYLDSPTVAHRTPVGGLLFVSASDLFEIRTERMLREPEEPIRLKWVTSETEVSPMTDQPHCAICDGAGKFPEHEYVMGAGYAYWRPTGRTKTCLTCNGSGVSPRARAAVAAGQSASAGQS